MDNKVIYYHEPFDARLDSEEMPVLKEDEILCKALYSVISTGSETISFRRQFDPTMHRCSELGHPSRVGYSMAAQVVAVGSEVETYQAGDRIYAHSNHKRYFTIKPGKLISHIPEGVEPEEACWLTVLRCGMFAVMKANVKMTDSVVVIGTGIFGIAAIQFAQACGARRIIAIDTIEKRVERAKAFGATHILHMDAADAIGPVMELCGGKKADCVIDATASAKGLASACMLTRNNGNISVIADPAELQSQCPGTNFLKGYLNIHGIFIDMMTEDPNFNYPTDIQDVHSTIFEMIKRGKIKARQMITHMVSPADVCKVYQALYDDRSDYLGVLYDWKQLDI